MGKHYVPQYYLRGFALPRDQRLVWMFDKQTRKWTCPAIKKAAQEQGFYSEEDEQQLAELEKPGNKALRILRAGLHLSEGQRAELAYYIAVLVMRGPQKRRKGEEIAPGVLEETISELRDGLSELRTESNAERVDALLRESIELEERYKREPPSSVTEQIRSPWPSGQIVATVRHMMWRVVRMPPGRYLVTSDTPAFYFESFGLGSDEAELTIAIDPSLAILGSYQGSPGVTLYLQGPPVIAAEINRRLTWGAERFVFSHRRDGNITALATRRRARLNRINWNQ